MYYHILYLKIKKYIYLSKLQCARAIKSANALTVKGRQNEDLPFLHSK